MYDVHISTLSTKILAGILLYVVGLFMLRFFVSFFMLSSLTNENENISFTSILLLIFPMLGRSLKLCMISITGSVVVVPDFSYVCPLISKYVTVEERNSFVIFATSESFDKILSFSTRVIFWLLCFSEKSGLTVFKNFLLYVKYFTSSFFIIVTL